MVGLRIKLILKSVRNLLRRRRLIDKEHCFEVAQAICQAVYIWRPWYARYLLRLWCILFVNQESLVLSFCHVSIKFNSNNSNKCATSFQLDFSILKLSTFCLPLLEARSNNAVLHHRSFLAHDILSLLTLPKVAECLFVDFSFLF